jgi:hypothetical protein
VRLYEEILMSMSWRLRDINSMFKYEKYEVKGYKENPFSWVSFTFTKIGSSWHNVTLFILTPVKVS